MPSPETTRSALSSPFMAKLSLGSAKSKSPQAYSPPPQGHNNPVQIDDVFSAETATPTPTLRSGIIDRPSGGEIERIHLQALEAGIAHFQDTEHRRPEFFKRTKRSPTDQRADTALDLEEQESALPGVGITASPMKGRRLKLFQETSEESFEESLMAGGYERYVSVNFLVQHTMLRYGMGYWLTQRSVMQTGYSSRSRIRLVHRHPQRLSRSLARKKYENGGD